jgi:hypothetical protein
MTDIDLVGSIGVVLMLFAFFLNISDRMSNDHPVYIFCNFLGSAMACYASVVIEYYPFVVLEGTWCIVSSWALYVYFVRDFRKKKS